MTNLASKAWRSGFRFVKYDVFYGTLLYPYGIMRHRAIVRGAARSQKHTYTCFYRSPGQLDALVGPVMAKLLEKRTDETFQINVFAASTGAEAYTIASTLLKAFPELDFRIVASDLHQEMVDRASAAAYSKDEVHRGVVTERFIADTFINKDQGYEVRPEIRARVSFKQASLLDPKLPEQFPTADIVFAQNVFCHLDERMSREAFANIARLLKPRSALFIDGMNLDLREDLTLDIGLTPLDYRCREIHEFARKHIADRWWNYYYGMEPYAFWRKSRVRRFSTIFFKGLE